MEGTVDKARAAPERRYDVDWVRALGMLMVFFFHSARLFDYDDWHAKNVELSYGMTVFIGVVSQWLMPLFFVLSGISAYFALIYLTGGKYINARIKRLFIPLVFGILAQVPLQVYIERVSHGQFSGSYFEFFPHYFDGFYAFGGNFAWMGLHLWYLEVLFIFSLITLPLFIWLKRDFMWDMISRTAGFFETPGSVLLLALPLVGMEMLVNLQPEGVGIRDMGGWSPLTYLVFFLLGYLLGSDARFKSVLERHRKAALISGIMTTVIGFILIRADYSTRTPFFSVLRSFNSWFWLVAILGFGARYLNFNNRVLKYANEAVLPFYILHQTVIVIVGFFIAGWIWGVPAKYLFLTTTSFALIMLLYELIKRVNPLRFLFGLKPKRRPALSQLASSNAKAA